jgi:hypothetical protein
MHHHIALIMLCMCFCFGSLSLIYHFLYTLNSHLSRIQASIILMQVAKISDTIFIKLVKNQSCNLHMFTHQAVVLPAATSSTAHLLASHRCHHSHSDPWLQWRLVQFVITLQYIQNLSFINLICHLRRFPCKNWSKPIILICKQKMDIYEYWKWVKIGFL